MSNFLSFVKKVAPDVSDLPIQLSSLRAVIRFNHTYTCCFIDCDGVIQHEIMCEPSEWDIFEKFEGKEIESDKIQLKYLPQAEVYRITLK